MALPSHHIPEQDMAMFPIEESTSETGEGASILFSEQVRAEIEGGGASTSHSAAQRPDNDMAGDAMGDMFFYVDDDAVPPTAGIMVDQVDGNDSPYADDTIMDQDPPEQPPHDVDIHYWLADTGDDDAQAEPMVRESSGAGPSQSRQSRRASPEKGARVAEAEGRRSPRNAQVAHETSPGFVPETEEDVEDDDEDDYEEPLSYHSGDSDEYEMEQRPWLERTAVKHDIQELYSIRGMHNPTLQTYRYRVVDRLGEGTFSSVYLAYDNLHNMHDNSYWAEDHEEVTTAEQLYKRSSTKVALKKILVTSSPARVENELSILENLRGCRHVSPLVSAFRDEDQIVIVLPYHPSDDFRYFYRLMDPTKMRQYMTCLLRALKDIHGRGIIHRDVKPANFLFDYEAGYGVLVDFGLAERYQPAKRPTCQHEPATQAHPHGARTKTADTVAVEQAVYDARKRAKAGDGRIGFRQEDSRPAVKTNRAGTRGFRAPEVLLKCPDQTVAIDVWSAGIMLLSLMAHKFPVFNSTDDVEALMEIAAVFGRGQMERCAMLHNRTVITNVPTVDNPPDSLASLILRLNPHLYTPHQPHPTPTEAMEHITSVDAALDLCSRLLRLDSTQRITAAQALRHQFLGDPADDGPDEIVPPTEGKCGHLHVYNKDGQHQARFGDQVEDMRYGQGIPPSRNSLCPEHEHWQQRSGVNPLGAAYGATQDEEYYSRAGFVVAEEHAAWDDCGERGWRD